MPERSAARGRSRSGIDDRITETFGMPAARSLRARLDAPGRRPHGPARRQQLHERDSTAYRNQTAAAAGGRRSARLRRPQTTPAARAIQITVGVQVQRSPKVLSSEYRPGPVRANRTAAIEYSNGSSMPLV